MSIHYSLPAGLRPASLATRRAFYARRMDYLRAEGWFRRFPGDRAFAVIVGRHSGIYPRRFRSVKNLPLIIDDVPSVSGLRPYLLRYLPEGVYYDRNAYRSLAEARRQRLDYAHAWGRNGFLGQELAFDLDPENLNCPVHGTIEDKMRRRQGLSFCDWEYEEIRREAADLADELSADWSDVRIVYSGRGFHIHVFDPEAFRLSRRRRLAMARRLGRRYAMDEWVTSGEMRLIRLRFSLEGMVARIVTPVARRDVDRFNHDVARAAPAGLA